MNTNPSRNGHLPINGLNLYYEVYGDLGARKHPLLLIPGAFMATDSMKTWAAAFARDRPVIVFDQQGHGRTPDTSREMSYEQFADDAAALLHKLNVDRADVMGWSRCRPPSAGTAGIPLCSKPFQVSMLKRSPARPSKPRS